MNADAWLCCCAKLDTSENVVTPRISTPSASIALASARMPRPLAFSERKSSSMMTIGKRKRMGGGGYAADGGPRIIRACLIRQQAAQFGLVYWHLGATVTRCYSSCSASGLRCVNSANLWSLSDSQRHSPEIVCNVL